MFDERGEQTSLTLEVAMDKALGTASRGRDFPRSGWFVALGGKEFQGGEDECMLLGGSVAGPLGPGSVYLFTSGPG